MWSAQIVPRAPSVIWSVATRGCARALETVSVAAVNCAEMVCVSLPMLSVRVPGIARLNLSVLMAIVAVLKSGTRVADIRIVVR